MPQRPHQPQPTTMRSQAMVAPSRPFTTRSTRYIATPQKTITFPILGTGPETLLFVDPDYDLSDNALGVSVLIAPATSTPSITTTSLANGQVGVAYSQNVTPAGGSR
jgi:hypothetical protein